MFILYQNVTQITFKKLCLEHFSNTQFIGYFSYNLIKIISIVKAKIIEDGMKSKYYHKDKKILFFETNWVELLLTAEYIFHIYFFLFVNYFNQSHLLQKVVDSILTQQSKGKPVEDGNNLVGLIVAITSDGNKTWLTGGNISGSNNFNTLRTSNTTNSIQHRSNKWKSDHNIREFDLVRIFPTKTGHMVESPGDEIEEDRQGEGVAIGNSVATEVGDGDDPWCEDKSLDEFLFVGDFPFEFLFEGWE